MSGVLEFAARVLEREGALVEPAEGGIAAVLPEGLRGALGLAEFCVLADGGGGGEPCGYGSEALGRVARIALGGGRAAAFRADIPDCPSQEPRCFHGLNVSVRVAGAQSRWGWTMLGLARYRASADDQREGLCRAAVSVPDGVPAPVPDLERLPLTAVPPGEVPAEPFRASLPKLLSALRAECVVDLGDFRNAVARRRGRDGERLRRYFHDVAADLKRRLGKKGGGEALQAKLESLPAELGRRLSQLDADSAVRVRMDLVGLAAVLGPGVVADLEVRRRKHTRILQVRHDGISRKWSGLRCDGCGAAATAFALCDEAAHVLCARCWDACGSGGRRPCFRCEGKHLPSPGSGTGPGTAGHETGWSGTVTDGGSERGPRASEDEVGRADHRETGAPARPEAATPATGAAAPSPAEARGGMDRREPAPAGPRSPPVSPRVEGRPRAPDAVPEEVIETILRLLEDSPEPLRNEDLRSAVGLDAEGVRKVLAPLIEGGLVGRIGERRGTRYFRSGPAKD